MNITVFVKMFLLLIIYLGIYFHRKPSNLNINGINNIFKIQMFIKQYA